MKTNFVSSVSHELRAPIASMRLLAESLERGKIPEAAKQQEYYRFLVQESRRLTSLIENVLDFSRIEQGRKEYQMEPSDLDAIAEQTVKLMLPAATQKQVELIWRPGPGPGPAPSCDGLAIQQALINLIDNAIKHSPAGTTVTVGREGGLPRDSTLGGRPGTRHTAGRAREDFRAILSPRLRIAPRNPGRRHWFNHCQTYCRSPRRPRSGAERRWTGKPLHHRAAHDAGARIKWTRPAIRESSSSRTNCRCARRLQDCLRSRRLPRPHRRRGRSRAAARAGRAPRPGAARHHDAAPGRLRGSPNCAAWTTRCRS